MESPQMLNYGRELPAPVVLTTRIIWAAIIMGQLCFAGVIVFLQHQGSLHPATLPLNIMIPIDAMMLAFAIAMGWLAPRFLINRKTNDPVPRRVYIIANIIPLACHEAATFFGLIMVMLSTHWWPAGVIPAVSIVLQLLRFPRAVIRGG
jgi:hypothetical protein